MLKGKELCLVNSLCLLLSLKNITVKNDAKLLFLILLISFGVGWRLMNTLCRMGHWKTIGAFFDNQISKRADYIQSITPQEIPLIFLSDSIYMHRPNKKYQRSFTVFNPKIWNFTGSGIIIPNIEDIKEPFVNPDTATNSQQNVLSMS